MRISMISLALLLAACSGADLDPARKTQDDAQARPKAASAPPVAPPVATPATAPPILDVPKVVGRSRDQVAEMIGPPVSCEDVKEGTKCIYDQVGTEIVFIDGKADWITVSRLGDARFESATLARLGLEPSNASFASEAVMRWSEHEGLLEVSLFPGQGGAVDYALVKAYTP
jgi:hypothetical protein